MKNPIWGVIGALVFGFALFIPLSATLWNIDYDYTLRVVALGGGLLGVLSGIVGSFAVLRQQALMGDALSHATLPGVAIAFLLFGRELPVLLIGAGIASALAVQFIRVLTQTTRIKQDTAMAIALVSWFALGLALLTFIQRQGNASQAGLDKFIFGQAAAIVERDVILILGASIVVIGILVVFWKELKLLVFDSEFAHANGFPTRSLELLLSTLIVVTIVLGLQLAGVILMVGMLISPAIASRQWTNRLSHMVLLSAVFGGFSGSLGAIISAVDVNLPTGALIIVVSFGLVALSLLFAPQRGILWQRTRPLMKENAS